MPPVGGLPATGEPLTQEQPTKSGWHLLQFADGSAAVVRFDNGAWQWGSQTAPTSNVTGMSYLGSNVTNLSLNLPKYANNLGGSIWPTLLSSIDHGFLSKGQPIVVNSQGQVPSSGDSPTSQQGSEATSAGINVSVPGANIAAGIWQWLTTASNWVRILEYVGGAVLIYMGIRALTGIGPDASDLASAAAVVK